MIKRNVARAARTHLAFLLLGLAVTVADAATAVVPGNANPNLAGREPGYACCSGDSLENEPAVLVDDLSLTPGLDLVFAVTGSVLHLGGADATVDNPDGSTFTGSPGNYGDGITSPTGVDRINALVGLFLSDSSPTGQPSPSAIHYSGLDFAESAPLIGQVFFIGDGLASDTLAGDFSGEQQLFRVPVGATRLYLGTADAFGWYNNSGAFNVSISPVPEPMAYLLMSVGLLVVVAGTSRRRIRN